MNQADKKKLSIQPKIAIIYLSFYPIENYWLDVENAINKINYPKELLTLLIIDTPHPEFGVSVKYIQEHILPLANKTMPEIVYLQQKKNTGFAGGNNVGLRWAVEHNFDFAFLHNQDGFFTPDCLRTMVQVMQADATIGVAQSLVMLYPKTDQINTAGNSYNFLGFGYVDHFGRKVSDLNLPAVKDIDYASGASLMMRVDLLRQYGLLDEDLFLYHEDIEYSLRLRLVGYRIVAAEQAVFFHKYTFNRRINKFYYIERNRYALLLMYYRWKTLVLLLPMLIFMELGLLFFFIKSGWWTEKVAIYRYWLQPANWKLWLSKRKTIQALRCISDRELLAHSTTTLFFGEKEEVTSPLLTYIANPVLRVSGYIVKKIIFW